MDASRLVAGTYLLLGDTLRLRDDGGVPIATVADEATATVLPEEDGQSVEVAEPPTERADES